MDAKQITKVKASVGRFTKWLEQYGETSYDHQSYYAGRLGRAAKALYYRKPLLGTAAVAPMVFSEAFLPAGRRLFWKPQRFPIADAHYAMGFAFLAVVSKENRYYQRAVHFLEVLKETRCRGYEDYCWGYPFDWETRTGTLMEGTPMVTTLPYVYEAFAQVYAMDRDERWLRIMRSIAEHGLKCYWSKQTGPDAASCAYTPAPDAPWGVINASAYRAFLLTRAAHDFSDTRYRGAADRNLNFVLASQNEDGSWYYAVDGERDFVDHFHTCFVMKALAKIEQITGNRECRRAIERGVAYYVENLFDENRLPKPFSRRPRMTVYRNEVYDYAECINLAVLLRGRFPELHNILAGVVSDVLSRWQKSDGSFRARKLLLGWDNVPMHRWAQSQLFRSLTFLLSREASTGPANGSVISDQLLEPKEVI